MPRASPRAMFGHLFHVLPCQTGEGLGDLEVQFRDAARGTSPGSGRPCRRRAPRGHGSRHDWRGCRADAPLLSFASFRRRATWFTLLPTRFSAALIPFSSSVMPSSGRRRSSAASIRQRMASDRWAMPRRARARIEATKVAVGHPHGQHTGAAVIGGDGGTTPAQHVVDGLGGDLKRRTDRTD